jgi:hypothetical protein
VTTTTGELIERLAADLRPVSRTAAGRRLLTGIGGGAAVSAIVMLLWLGIRPDFVAALGTGAFWVKFGYTILLTLAGLWAVDRLARPGGNAGGALIAGGTVFIVLLAWALVQLMEAPATAERQLMFGRSASVCPWIILVLSVPIFVGAVWAMRGLAPTRLGFAGLAGGLMAGGAAAWIYSFHCDETAIPFLAIWYSAGIALFGIVGAALGRWLLRW